MKTMKARQFALAMLAAVAVAAPGAALGQDTELKGMITSHEGSTIVLRTADGDKSVHLTDATKIRGTSGALGVRGESHPPSDLIRGLAVSVTTVEDGSNVNAAEITFKNSDLKTARQIMAGIDTTEKRVTENAERIDNVGLLVPAGRTKVFFPVGSATISAKGQEDLQAIARQAKEIKGAYRLVVVGRADTTGNAAANERLSARRAAAVKAYLTREAGISPENFIAPAALGSAPIAQDPDPPGSPSEARRVTVTIAVSKSNQPK